LTQLRTPFDFVMYRCCGCREMTVSRVLRKRACLRCDRGGGCLGRPRNWDTCNQMRIAGIRQRVQSGRGDHSVAVEHGLPARWLNGHQSGAGKDTVGSGCGRDGLYAAKKKSGCCTKCCPGRPSGRLIMRAGTFRWTRAMLKNAGIPVVEIMDVETASI